MSNESFTPLVSVGMPVHNGEEFVAEAIDAILTQEDTDLELVISDNGSSDNTESICREFAARDSRVRYLRRDENRGAAWNFNNAVHEARGRYFQWAAHDDLRTPRAIAQCVEVLEHDPNVALCYGRAVDIDPNGHVLHEYPPLQYATGDDPVGRGLDVLSTPSPCFEVFGLMRRDDLLMTAMIGPYTSSDRTLLYELALLGRFHEVPEVLFLHRQHDARSVFTHSDPRERDAWFDPGRADTVTLPRWRLVGEHFRAVWRVPMASRRNRIRAVAHVTTWAASKGGVLARDLVAWGRHKLSAP